MSLGQLLRVSKSLAIRLTHPRIVNPKALARISCGQISVDQIQHGMIVNIQKLPDLLAQRLQIVKSLT